LRPMRREPSQLGARFEFAQSCARKDEKSSSRCREFCLQIVPPIVGGYSPNWRASASARIGGAVLVTSLQSEKNRSRHIGSRNGRHGVREQVLNFSGITRLGPRSIGETQETTMQPDEQVGECANLLRWRQPLILRVR
jgi:hypothetical protein